MTQIALDAAYNNGAAVSDSLQWLDTWRKRSATLREVDGAQLDIPYGLKQRQRLDFFSSGAAAAPLFVFIHGGYWQRNAKELFSFVASGPMAHGIDVAVIGYTLAPEARLSEIVDEVQEGLAFLRKNANLFRFNPETIYVGGWSAGGHLAAMVCNHPDVKGVLAISGIFDLEPIALSYLNAPLQLNPHEIATLSPLKTLGPGAVQQCVAVGGNELPELKRQSALYAETAQRLRLPASLYSLSGHHHFSILDELSDPDGVLTCELLKQMQKRQ